ncbi:hypothetical protein Dda_6913 [Drechslerella dactyloides]|uniref:Uncharacterized protein n=1 Tax=Drechslerella dactyloides TaxID=74499 RepID=A0AAD6IWH3_DREDA|nr:hypothetical protein Dda_6913 [Drechslerella dactyloides]
MALNMNIEASIWPLWHPHEPGDFARQADGKVSVVEMNIEFLTNAPPLVQVEESAVSAVVARCCLGHVGRNTPGVRIDREKESMPVCSSYSTNSSHVLLSYKIVNFTVDIRQQG